MLSKLQSLYAKYRHGVTFVEVESNGKRNIGSGFHVGDGIVVTARHVVENKEVKSLGPLPSVVRGEGEIALESEGAPCFHPDASVDVAFLRTNAANAEILPLGSHLDDWIDGNAFVLSGALVLGYPPIPQSDSPVLVAQRTEVVAVIDKYTSRHPHFVIGSIPRPGFSGGPVISEWSFVLGMFTESLVECEQATELGYSAILSIEPILVTLGHHRALPRVVRELWEDDEGRAVFDPEFMEEFRREYREAFRE